MSTYDNLILAQLAARYRREVEKFRRLIELRLRFEEFRRSNELARTPDVVEKVFRDDFADACVGQSDDPLAELAQLIGSHAEVVDFPEPRPLSAAVTRLVDWKAVETRCRLARAFHIDP